MFAYLLEPPRKETENATSGSAHRRAHVSQLRRVCSTCCLALVVTACPVALADSREDDDLTRLVLGSKDDLSLAGLLDIIDLVVTPAKVALAIDRAPSIISLIKNSDFKDDHFRSVAEALRQVPGVYVRDDLVQVNVSMRGIDAGLRAWSRDLKVMINGQPVSYRSDTANWLGPELLPTEVIDRVEVIRGPSSTLYGANAFLGVVNVITAVGGRSPSLRATVESGVTSSVCRQTAAQVEGRTVDLCQRAGTTIRPALRASLTYGQEIHLGQSSTVNLLGSIALGYADRSGRLLPDSSPHFQDTGPRYFDGSVDSVTSSGDTEYWLTSYAHAHWIQDALGKLSLDFYYSEFARFGEFADWGVLTHENRVGLRNLSLVLGHDKRLQSLPVGYRWRLSLASGGDTPRNRLQIARENAYWVRKQGGYLGLDMNAELFWEISSAWRFTVGAALTRDRHDLPSISSVEPSLVSGGEPLEIPSYQQGAVTFVNIAMFSQLFYAPSDRLSAIVGVSFERHNVYGQCRLGSCPGLNSRLGLTYSWLKTSGHAVYSKLLYGSAYKAPSAELLYGTPYVVSGISGNLELEPEVAHSFELAVGGHAEFFGGRLLVETLANGYTNLVDGRVEYIQAGNFIQARNSSDLLTVGFESTLRASYKRTLRGYINLSWQTTSRRKCLLADEAVCLALDELNPLYPGVLTSFGLRYRIQRWKTSVSTYGVFVGGRWSSQSNRAENLPSLDGAGADFKAYRLPAYLRWNFVLSSDALELWKGHPALITLAVYNLLNVSAPEPGFAGVDVPGDGISSMLSLRQAF